MDFAAGEHPRLSETSIPSDLTSSRMEFRDCLVTLSRLRTASRSIKREKRNRERTGRRKDEYEDDDDGDDEESVGFLSDQPRHYLNIPTPALSALAAARTLVRSLFYTLFTLSALFFFQPLSFTTLARARVPSRTIFPHLGAEHFRR